MAKILVIDDDQMLRETVRQILSSGGHRVVAAKDGIDGLAAAWREHPDLVITDILMPGKEGLETIMEMRRRWPETKIIAISGGGSTGTLDYLDAAQRLGASDALAKPFSALELLEHVRDCLEAGNKMH